MTLVAGFYDGNVAWIGGDSGAFEEDESVILTETKVWKVDGFLVGACGGFRLAEIAYESGIGDPFKLRDHLEAWWNANSSTQADNDTSFIVINQLGIWYIGEDFSVVRSKENYGAIGWGKLPALAALLALNGIEMPPKIRITKVLKASAYHTTKIRAPFKTVSL